MNARHPHEPHALAPLAQARVGQQWEEIAEEVPVALCVSGTSQAVMMATPADLEDFAFGFALTEGWITQRADVLDCAVNAQATSVVVDLQLTGERAFKLNQRRRTLAGRTGCGLCGVESLAQLPQIAAPMRTAPATIDAAALARAGAQFASAQPLHARCGALHGAAWCNPQGDVLLVREDVGRHNALDKLIGALLLANTPTLEGFVLISSRASYELVAKCAAANIGALASISAPTAHAVRTAQQGKIALWGFVRQDRATRYA